MNRVVVRVLTTVAFLHDCEKLLQIFAVHLQVPRIVHQLDHEDIAEDVEHRALADSFSRGKDVVVEAVALLEDILLCPLRVDVS